MADWYRRALSAREGHARIPYTHKEDGIKLGSWVVTQRTDVDDLSNDRRARLQSLPGWSWAVSEDTWNEKYQLMKAFAAREGHARVPQGDVEDGIALGKWLTVQRQKRDKLTADRSSCGVVLGSAHRQVECHLRALGGLHR